MKEYEFKIYLNGVGDTAEEAWIDAVECFSIDPGSSPNHEDIYEYANEYEDEGIEQDETLH